MAVFTTFPKNKLNPLNVKFSSNNYIAYGQETEKTENFSKEGESLKQCHGIMTKDMTFGFQSEMQTLEAKSFSKNGEWLAI